MNQPEFELHPQQLENISTVDYDLALCALGYEARAVEMYRLTTVRAARSIALGFDFGNALSYENNLRFFQKQGLEIFLSVAEDSFEELCRDILGLAAEKTARDEPCRILIDISCFNRYRLAVIVHVIRHVSKTKRVEVDFFYSVARYEHPSHEYIPNSVVSPVHPAFAGWSSTPANPTAAIVGLGYEQDQALGIVEYLQANPVWLFSPMSSERRYLAAVNTANALLLEELPATNLVSYDVEQPADTFKLLDGMARGLQHDHNVVIVPFGPKIFVLCSLLTAWRHPSAAVWRVSPGSRIDPRDRKASKFRCLLRLCAGISIDAVAID